MKSIRKKDAPVLLLDNGNTCPIIGENPTKRTDIILKSMKDMGYAAVNAGPNEICCRQSILNHHLPNFPVITSNLADKRTGKPAATPFLIKSVGGIRVGILGILPPDALTALSDDSFSRNYDIIAPEAAIKDYLPDLKRRSDLVILLSQCNPVTTRELISQTKGIDIAIVSGNDGKLPLPDEGCDNDSAIKPMTNDQPIILNTGKNGKSIGYLKIAFSGTNDITGYQGKTIYLDRDVSDDPGIKSLIDAFLRDPNRQKRNRILQNKKRRNEIESLQQMSPEEYVKTLKP